jgi:FkbM family methyltransferase
VPGPANTILPGWDEPHVQQLVSELGRAGATLSRREDGYQLDLDDLCLHLTQIEELHVAHEIFVTGVYDLQLPEPGVVLDIGMNVGIAALSFAGRSWVRRVHAFELFVPTYLQGLQNLALNPMRAARIEASPFGLAAADGTFELEYCPRFRGSTGLFGVDVTGTAAGPGVVQAAPRTREHVEVRRASAVLAPLLDRADDERVSVVAKLDCEGAEYDIVRDLAGEGLLSRIRALVVEWHERGPEELLDALAHDGFATLSFRLGPTIGYVVAVGGAR